MFTLFAVDVHALCSLQHVLRIQDVTTGAVSDVQPWRLFSMYDRCGDTLRRWYWIHSSGINSLHFFFRREARANWWFWILCQVLNWVFFDHVFRFVNVLLFWADPVSLLLHLRNANYRCISWYKVLNWVIFLAFCRVQTPLRSSRNLQVGRTEILINS